MTFSPIAETVNNKEPTCGRLLSVTYQVGCLIEDTQIVSHAVKLPFY